MKLDIILITYNQEQYIAQAVESILMQRVNDDVQVRVIVADDCSKDQTLEIIKSFEQKSPFPFLYLLSEKNMGIAENYKRAFEACDGDYVAILEGDDWWTDVNRLQKHVDYLSTHMDCVLTKNNYLQYNEKLKEYSQNVPQYHVVTLRKTINNHILVNLSAYVFDNKILRKIDKEVYNYGYVQRNEALDWYLNLYLLKHGYGWVFEEIMSVYRVNTGNNISLSKRTEQEELEKASICFKQSLALLGNEYYNECYQIYLSTKNYLHQNKINRKIQYWSNYIPPILVAFVLKIFPQIYKRIKSIIRQCIPHRFYYMIRKKENLR